MHREALIQWLKLRYPNHSALARLLGFQRSYITHIYSGLKPLTPEVIRRVRDRLPGSKRRADLALRELMLLPSGGSPADSQDTKEPVAV